jgi:competence ComEA-like helix-hairpin-helix protein
MDPLAELVKIDPKSIGVGQYQHDVDQFALKRGLDDVVMSCVNAVGVEINTASAQLLGYVSGLGPSLAKAIVAHRGENGPFRSRKEFKKVPRLGPKVRGILTDSGFVKPSRRQRRPSRELPGGRSHGGGYGPQRHGPHGR